MNKTKIDWADRSWNPVTGCLHGCKYCYAKQRVLRMAGYWNGKLNYVPDITEFGNCLAAHDKLKYKTKKGSFIRAPWPFGFIPTFYHYRLTEPQMVRKSSNIFTCSMGDLFGSWVPDEWIQKVFKACEAAPQHRYLFLTKNPKRYSKLWDITQENYWFGATVTNGSGCFDANEYLEGSNCFLSIEPIMENIINFKALYKFQWIIVGAETGNRQGKVTPKREWIENIVRRCKSFNVPVFMKNNLAGVWDRPLIQEYPWKMEDTAMTSKERSLKHGIK